MMATALSTLRDAGFAVAVTPAGKLRVTPASKLTPELRQVIGQHRDELLMQLTGRAAANDARSETVRTTPPPATERTPAQVVNSGVVNNLVNKISPDWKDLDRAYQAHHVNCPVCIAAGKGHGQRCGTGAALWADYDQTTKPAPARAWAAPAPKPTADVHPSLMTAATPDEVNRMVKRLALFALRGLTEPQADKLTDALLVRDRDGCGQGACAECIHLRGNAPGRWRCGDTTSINDLAGAWLGAAFVHQHLHHCDGFKGAA